MEKPRKYDVRRGRLKVWLAVVTRSKAIDKYRQLSNLSGDELNLSTIYEGNGLVSVQIENRSDKALHFQSALKLVQWNIRIQLLTFEQIEQYKIYEDNRYVCYGISDLFYTDLRQYLEDTVNQRSDTYFDEQVWERVKNIYHYYKGNLRAMPSKRNRYYINRKRYFRQEN